MAVSKDSREQRRAQARAQREAAEQAANRSDQRRQRLTILGGILVAAVVVVVAVVLIAGNHGSDDKATAASSASAPVANSAAIQAQLGGVPQKANMLGRADAPITIVEYGDLQCPVCANFSNTVMPGVVQDYIRQGKARIQFRNFAFIGDDSTKLAQAALAAGLQNKQFDFNELVYANQGQENSGYATDDYIKRIFSSIPGLNVAKAVKDMDSQEVSDLLAKDLQLSQTEGINATPTILVGRSGQTPTAVNYTDLPTKLQALTA
jgi:protein-disulfide isomerase